MPITTRHHNLLPVTKQATVYRAGDDGTFQAGVPGTQFSDNGDGTVTDFHTGLMFVRTPHLLIPGADGLTANNEILSAEGAWSNLTDYIVGALVQGDGAPDALFYVCILANGPGGVGAQEPPNATYWVVTPFVGSAANLTTAGTMIWDDAVDNCLGTDWGGSFEYAGFADWRLTNMHELGMLYNADDTSPPSMLPPFVITSGDIKFWSSNTRKASTTQAQRVAFGSDYDHDAEVKSLTFSVMPVRGGRFNA